MRISHSSRTSDVGQTDDLKEKSSVQKGEKFDQLVQDSRKKIETASLTNQFIRDLRGIAGEYARGQTSFEDANKQFVGLVIKQQFPGGLGKLGKKAEMAVADFVQRDPYTSADLKMQLSKMTHQK